MSVIKLTSENFEEEVIKSEIPVVVDFWAEWCGPCRMQSPIVDDLAETMQGKLKVGKINVDEEGDLAAEYGIMSIPTLVFFNNGKVTNTAVGLHSKQEILDLIIK